MYIVITTIMNMRVHIRVQIRVVGYDAILDDSYQSYLLFKKQLVKINKLNMMRHETYFF